ncbi:MAG: aminoacyl-tRNA hydrolase [Planctomycetota bacterium]
MKLIVGLGNPGPQYAQTRHNAGFMALDALARRHGLTGERGKFHALALEGAIPAGGSLHRVALLKPITFMNRSGLSVGEARAFFKVEVENILVLVDDVALPTGNLRLRASGSAGGHNGLKDIERVLGTRDYPRLRIGIDRAPGRIPQVDYVLGKFSEAESDALAPALTRSCEVIESWLAEGVVKTMARFNGGDD